MREIVHIQAGQCGNQIGSKVTFYIKFCSFFKIYLYVKVECFISRKKITKKVQSKMYSDLDNFSRRVFDK